MQTGCVTLKRRWSVILKRSYKIRSKIKPDSIQLSGFVADLIMKMIDSGETVKHHSGINRRNIWSIKVMPRIFVSNNYFRIWLDCV